MNARISLVIMDTCVYQRLIVDIYTLYEMCVMRYLMRQNGRLRKHNECISDITVPEPYQ